MPYWDPNSLDKNIPQCHPLRCQGFQFKSIFIIEKSVLAPSPMLWSTRGPLVSPLPKPLVTLASIEVFGHYKHFLLEHPDLLLLKRLKGGYMCINHAASWNTPPRYSADPGSWWMGTNWNVLSENSTFTLFLTLSLFFSLSHSLSLCYTTPKLFSVSIPLPLSWIVFVVLL